MHSLRSVPTNRSANAFARGDRTGVLMTLMPSVRNTSLKLKVNFVSQSPDEELGCSGALAKIRGEVASLLDDPLPRRVGGDASQVDPSSVDLDEEQHVEASEQHRVDGEEVAGQHGPRLRSQELRPGWARSATSRFDAMPAEDCPHAHQASNAL